MEKITMTRKQLKRNTVITQVIDGLITREKAAELLELSVRQIDRIKKSYLQEGVESLIHKNTGRKPAHALDEETKEKVIRTRSTFPYSQANFKHFQELLELHHGIHISYSSLYALLKGANISSPLKQRKRKCHRRAIIEAKRRVRIDPHQTNGYHIVCKYTYGGRPNDKEWANQYDKRKITGRQECIRHQPGSWCG
jgi:transposase